MREARVNPPEPRNAADAADMIQILLSLEGSSIVNRDKLVGVRKFLLANARLMDSAPELLRALKRMLQAGTEKEEDVARDIAEAAIAKAEGRS